MKKDSGYPAISEVVLWQIARDIAFNVRENGWDEDDALNVMYNLTKEAKEGGPISTIQEAYDRAMAKKEGRPPSHAKKQ